MPGVYKVVNDKTNVYKYLRKESRVGYIIYQSLKDSIFLRRRKIDYFNHLIENGNTLKYIGKNLVEGTLLKSVGNYFSPIIKGDLISEISINDLDNKKSFHLLFSIEELLNNLRNYNNEVEKLIGDWSLHNLIFCSETGYIINIDLEGLYTYSKIGPELPWEKKENLIPFITGQFKEMKKSIITKFSQLKISEHIPYISLIILKNRININWVYPFYYKNEQNNIKDNIFYIDFGEIDSYTLNKYSVYFILKNQNKVTQIILEENAIPPKDAVLFFKFSANKDKGYEHPIGVKLIKKLRPLRTILKISDKKGDFYIKKFYK